MQILSCQSISRVVKVSRISNAMSEIDKMKKEVLQYELDQMRMARKRAKDSPLRAMVIAQREVELEAEIQKLSEGEAA